MSVIVLAGDRAIARDRIVTVRPDVAALCGGNFTGAVFPSRATLRGNTYALTSQGAPWTTTPGGIGYRPRTGATGTPYYATLDPITIATGYTVCFSLFGALYDYSYIFSSNADGANGIALKLAPTGYFGSGDGPIGVKVTHYGYAEYSTILSSDSPLNKVCHCVLTGGTDNAKLWINGSYIGSATTGPIGPSTTPAIYGSTSTYGGAEYYYGSHLHVFASGTRIPDELAREVSKNPYIILYGPNKTQPRYFAAPSGGGATITGDSGSYTLTGTDVSLKAGRKLAADSGTYTLTGTAATLKVGRKLAADSGAYSLTGADVAFKRGYALNAESGSYTLSGTTVSLKAGRKLAADSGSYTLTGTDATLTYSPAGSYTLTAESGSYTLTGTAATLKVSRKLTADSGTYALTGTAAGLAKGVRLTAESGSYTLTGSNVAFARTYVLTAESGAYTLTGTSAGLTWSGAPVVEVPTNGGPSIYGKPVFREREFRREYEEQVKRIEDEKRLARILREDEEIICIMALMAA